MVALDIMQVRMRRVCSIAAIWSVFASFPAGCDGCRSPSESAPAARREAPTPVDGLPDTEELRTPDGLKVIVAKRDPAKEAAEEARRKKELAHLVREPTEPDPLGGDYPLEKAVEGLGTDGTLVAEIVTDLGTMFCDLFAEEAPRNVANFIGLARGRRRWWDARAGAWVLKRYYDGTTFHRVVPDYLIQGGDYLGDGSGTIGYFVPDEPNPSLRHDQPGLLCMASHGKDQNGAQFFVTDGPTPDLDRPGLYTIIGRCQPLEVVRRIARVPQTGRPDYRPLTPLHIRRVHIRRVVGGAAKAKRTPPVPPAGVKPGERPVFRGASPGPSELRPHLPKRPKAAEPPPSSEP